MAFTNIDATKPAGTEKVSTADNYIRELKVDIETNLAEISGYPDNAVLKKSIWTTAERPSSNLTAGLFGYNTTLSSDEHYDGSSWIASRNVPIGGIILWYGAIANIPTGWSLCNGSNGTPDLRDKFIVGAGNSYVAGDNATPTHLHSTAEMTLSLSQIPSHQHVTPWGEKNLPAPWGTYATGQIGSASTDWDNYWSYTSPAGGGGAHGHGNTGSSTCLPPYYALAYIMRIS